jgi:hypothetical protein
MNTENEPHWLPELRSEYCAANLPFTQFRGVTPVGGVHRKVIKKMGLESSQDLLGRNDYLREARMRLGIEHWPTDPSWVDDLSSPRLYTGRDVVERILTSDDSLMVLHSRNTHGLVGSPIWDDGLLLGASEEMFTYRVERLLLLCGFDWLDIWTDPWQHVVYYERDESPFEPGSTYDQRRTQLRQLDADALDDLYATIR